MAEFEELVDRGVEPREAQKIAGEKVQGVLEPGVLTGQVPLPKDAGAPALPHTRGCNNSQCRVVEYTPDPGHRACPACYGTEQS